MLADFSRNYGAFTWPIVYKYGLSGYLAHDFSAVHHRHIASISFRRLKIEKHCYFVLPSFILYQKSDPWFNYIYIYIIIPKPDKTENVNRSYANMSKTTAF